LEGERKALEGLKIDMIKRVKMLEFAIRQERSKKEGPSLADQRKPSVASIDTVATDTVIENYRKGFGHSKSREMLKKYFNMI
jgi:striatin 1/3/4